MIGHEKIIADLKNLHERGVLSHGYVFFGPAMVGKRTAAMDFARFLESDVANASNAAADTRSETSVLSDMMLVVPGENGSIGIDAVRGIRNFLWQKPNASSRRTLIIDDAELLTTEAQNALLKVTEEPPVSSLLILVTSDADSILPTILSRLPKIYFGTVAEKEIEGWLEENNNEKEAPATVPEKKKTTAIKKQANELARKAMGKPGLAWRLIHDEDFQEQIALAEKLLKTPAAARRDIIKKIIEPDEFSFRKFLDAIIVTLAWQEIDAPSGIPKKSGLLWHKALALYDRETNFSLNPRLQLESLLL